MIKPDLDRKQKTYVLLRSIRDYAMGIFLIGIGLFFFFSMKIINTQVIEDPILRYMCLIIFLLYGGFRAYRGYAKQYYRRDEE